MTDWIGGFAKLAQAYPKATPATEFRERLANLAASDQSEWKLIFENQWNEEQLADYLFDT